MAFIDELIELAEQQIEEDRLTEQQRQLFWIMLRRRADAKIEKAERKPVVPVARRKLEEMSDERAERFSKIEMPAKFRKHAGEPVGDVPYDYLEYLVDEDEFVAKIRSYLRSGWVRRRRMAEDHE